MVSGEVTYDKVSGVVTYDMVSGVVTYDRYKYGKCLKQDRPK